MPTFFFYPDVFTEQHSSLDLNVNVSILNSRETISCKGFEIFLRSKIKLMIYFPMFFYMVFHWFCYTAVLGQTGGK